MTSLGLIGKAFASALLGAALVLSAGCTYRGDLDSPLAQKFTWFSLLNGDDVREACHEGAPDRIRLVYNGRYHEQLRVYDIVAADPAGPNAGGAQLSARVQDSASYGKLGSLDVSTPLSAWGWQRAGAALDAEAFRRLQRALEQAGVGAPAPAGTELRSSRFYWVAIVCAGGRVWFQAWQAPESDVTRLPFVPLLLEADRTGVPFNAPRPLSAAEMRIGEPGPEKERESYGFSVKVGENGLAGHL